MRYFNRLGARTEIPMPFSVKMEALLRQTQNLRQQHIARLRERGDTRAQTADFKFDGNDMKAVMKFWLEDFRTWMNPETLEKYRGARSQNAHQVLHRAFRSHRFHLSGSPFLLEILIQMPFFVDTGAEPAVQPHVAAVLPSLMAAYAEHKNSDEYIAARKSSEQRKENTARLSNEIWWAQWEHERGRLFSTYVKARDRDFFSLTERQHRMVEDFDTGASQRKLRNLIAKRTPLYLGATAHV